MTDTDTDVLVVGGGPVGLAAAIEARLAGLHVVVVEPRAGTIDKACGEGLMPGTLAALARLGVDPAGHPITGISYRRTGRHVDHTFSTGPGRGVRRTTLHDALAARADELGVERLAARVEEVETGPGTVAAGGVTARWLLGCDGLHSTVRNLVGLEPPAGGRRPGPGRRPAQPGPGRPAARSDPRPGRRFGLRRHYRLRPWTDLVEVHWADRAEAYVTPVAGDLVGVALLGPPGTGFDATLAWMPELSARLGGAPADGPVRGAGPLLQRTTGRTAGRVRLVGDAPGYVDALTGEGLRVGLAQARAAIATLDDPAAYERSWRSVTRDYRLITSGLVRWATSPLRDALVPVAVRAPLVFGTVVERLSR